MFAVINYSSIR